MDEKRVTQVDSAIRQSGAVGVIAMPDRQDVEAKTLPEQPRSVGTAELDPEDPRAVNLLRQVYVRLDRPEDALQAYRRQLELVERYLELNPDDLSQAMLGANALLALGERERAFEWAGRITEAADDDTLVLYNNACFYSLAGDKDRAFAALAKAVDAGDRDVAWWRQDSDLDNLRDDPQFEELIARMEANQ